MESRMTTHEIQILLEALDLRDQKNRAIANMNDQFQRLVESGAPDLVVESLKDMIELFILDLS